MSESPEMTRTDAPVAGAFDRRGFLRTTAGGTAALFVASLLPAGCAADYPQAQADGVALRTLSPKEYATARAAAEALLSGVPVTPARIASDIDRELSLVGDPVRHDMKTVLALLEHATILGGHVRPMSSLSPSARLRYLEGWRDSRFDLRRGAFGAIKAFVYFYAFSKDATRPLTGYPGPWPERYHIPPTPVDFGPVA